MLYDTGGPQEDVRESTLLEPDTAAITEGTTHTCVKAAIRVLQRTPQITLGDQVDTPNAKGVVGWGAAPGVHPLL